MRRATGTRLVGLNLLAAPASATARGGAPARPAASRGGSAAPARGVWNQNLTVKPQSIQVVLDTSINARAESLSASRLDDNGLVDQVDRACGRRLFLGAFM